MSVQIEIDASDVLRELRRLSDGPDTADLVRLNTVTAAQFLATQAAVHVITGSLKTSGRFHTSWDRATHEYTGEVTYGGEAPGAFHENVTYAKYEQRRAGIRAVYPGKYSLVTKVGHRTSMRRVWDNAPRTEATSHDFMAPVNAFERFYAEAIIDFMAGRP